MRKPIHTTTAHSVTHRASNLNLCERRLAFNARVLAQARDSTHPLLDRVKLLAISANNLDEFHMVGLASLLRQRRADVDAISPDGLDIDERVERVREAASGMLQDLGICWEELEPLLAERDIHYGNFEGAGRRRRSSPKRGIFRRSGWPRRSGRNSTSVHPSATRLFS